MGQLKAGQTVTLDSGAVVSYGLLYSLSRVFLILEMSCCI